MAPVMGSMPSIWEIRKMFLAAGFILTHLWPLQAFGEVNQWMGEALFHPHSQHSTSQTKFYSFVKKQRMWDAIPGSSFSHPMFNQSCSFLNQSLFCEIFIRCPRISLSRESLISEGSSLDSFARTLPSMPGPFPPQHSPCPTALCVLILPQGTQFLRLLDGGCSCAYVLCAQKSRHLLYIHNGLVFILRSSI